MRGLIASCVIAAATPALADRAVGVFEDDTVEVTPTQVPIDRVQIDNPYGAVRIEGHDGGGLVIQSSKRATSDEVLDRLRVSLLPDLDGGVRIVAALDPEGAPVAKDNVRIDLVIKAPRRARIDARVLDGALRVAHMDGGAELDSAGGAIVVENVAGSVFARSVGGDQRFADVFGIVDSQAVSAELSLDTVRGARLAAMVYDGRIDGRHIHADRVELATTRGDIFLDGDALQSGLLRAASVRGDVEVRLRRSRRGVTVSAQGANVVVDGGRPIGGGKWVFGGPVKPAFVELRSRYGSVRFAVVE